MQFDKNSLNQKWSFDLPTDHSFGHKGCECTNQSIIFVTHKSQKTEDSVVQAVDPINGKKLWEYSISWGLKNFLVHFNLTKEKFYLFLFANLLLSPSPFLFFC